MTTDNSSDSSSPPSFSPYKEGGNVGLMVAFGCYEYPFVISDCHFFTFFTINQVRKRILNSKKVRV